MNYAVGPLALALDVSVSGFHAHQRKDQGQRWQEGQALGREIRSVFATSRQTYGCLRVTAASRQRGVRCGKNRVMRLMRENHLRPN